MVARLENRLDNIHNYGLDEKNRVIYINSEGQEPDGSETGIDFRVATVAIKNIDYLNSISSDAILIKLGSCGGDVGYGFAIYDAIKSSVAPIDILGYSDIASMSSIILQSGRIRRITKHSSVMVHLGSYNAVGGAKQVTSGLDFYKKSYKAMYHLYAERCVNGVFFKKSKMKKDAVAAYIESIIGDKEDWWMTSSEALLYGFCDEIV